MKAETFNNYFVTMSTHEGDPIPEIDEVPLYVPGLGKTPVFSGIEDDQ